MARSKGGRRKTAGARTPARKASRKKSAKSASRKSARASSRKKTASARTARKASLRSRKRPVSSRRTTARSAKRPASRKRAATSAASRPRRGGTGSEETLSQTPETGRSVKGRTNPMATRRSTGTPAGAGSMRNVPGLNRERKQLRELEETIQGPPSSLDMDRNASAARSGRRHLQDTLEDHNETSPALTGGDVDADWEDAYAVGDEAPGGDNPTPDQDRVDDIGKALGVTYEDNEELKASDKIAERDKHRWELDPASSDDYRERE